MSDRAAAEALVRLLEIMRRLRDPETGCPWDVEQTFQTIAPYTVEEAYEVADAIERGAFDELLGELGDLLLQVVYHARIAEEQGRFGFAEVARAIADKMVRRHPHVFGEDRVASATAQRRAWEAVKAEERARKAADPSVLADLPLALPALSRAQKLQARAARVGFDWGAVAPVLAKIREELDELEAALGQGHDAREDELGDVLFALVNLARHLEVDAETALRRTNRKFEDRFRWIEARLAAEGAKPEQRTLAELDRLWNEAKRALAKDPAG